MSEGTPSCTNNKLYISFTKDPKYFLKVNTTLIRNITKFKCLKKDFLSFHLYTASASRSFRAMNIPYKQHWAGFQAAISGSPLFYALKKVKAAGK